MDALLNGLDICSTDSRVNRCTGTPRIAAISSSIAKNRSPGFVANVAIRSTSLPRRASPLAAEPKTSSRVMPACGQYDAMSRAMSSTAGGNRERRGACLFPFLTSSQNAAAFARLATVLASDRAFPPFRLNVR